ISLKKFCCYSVHIYIYTHTHTHIYIYIYTHTHTLYCQSHPWPQVCKIKHLGMHTASTNICERMGCSQELSAFKHGTVIICHLCNKSNGEISLLLNIPRSAVSGIITKWKQLETTATQPRSGRPCKMTEWGQ
ncbi:unnamed protein product, partial [Staurois parvus]